MDYAAGGTLDGRIAQQREAGEPFCSETILRWLAEMASALEHMHSHRVLHRDMKPANVLLSAEGEIKLADFGVSRLLGSQTSLAQTVLGTPFYMSPELFKGEPYSQPTDVWALGVVLFELLTLQRWQLCSPSPPPSRPPSPPPRPETPTNTPLPSPLPAPATRTCTRALSPPGRSPAKTSAWSCSASANASSTVQRSRRARTRRSSSCSSVARAAIPRCCTPTPRHRSAGRSALAPSRAAALAALAAAHRSGRPPACSGRHSGPERRPPPPPLHPGLPPFRLLGCRQEAAPALLCLAQAAPGPSSACPRFRSHRRLTIPADPSRRGAPSHSFSRRRWCRRYPPRSDPQRKGHQRPPRAWRRVPRARAPRLLRRPRPPRLCSRRWRWRRRPGRWSTRSHPNLTLSLIPGLTLTRAESEG